MPLIHQHTPCDARADRIIAVALAVFVENGFACTRLADIARRARVSTSTLLLHFPSKEAIFREVIRSTLIAAVQASEEVTARASGSIADAVRRIAHCYWSTMGRPEAVAIARLAVSELPRFPELAALHATEAIERFLRLLEKVIEAGVARGELKPVDAKALARVIHATLTVHAFWFAHPEIYAGVTGIDRDGAAASTIDTLLRALAQPTRE